jgi:hypothetical protein
MRNVNPLGLLIVAVGVFGSFCISIYQGLMLSTTPWIAGIYALIGAAAVVWEMTGWHRCAHLLRERRPLAFGMSVIGLVLASCVTILLFELAFLATALEGAASRNMVAIDTRAALEMERSQLQAGMTKGGASRGLAAVESDIEGIKAHPRWASTHSCDPEWTTAKDSRALCERYAAAISELGLAKSAETAQTRIKEISVELVPLGQIGASDARALYIDKILGTGEQGARAIVGALVIAFLLFCRAVAPFVMWDSRPTCKELLQVQPAAPVQVAVVKQELTTHEAPIEARTAVEAIPGYAGSAEHNDAAPAVNVATLTRMETEEEMLARIEAEVMADLDEAIAEQQAAQRDDTRPAPITVHTPAERKQIAAAMAERVSLDDAESMVRRFAGECLVRDKTSREGATALYLAFSAWASANSLPSIRDQSLFGKVMTAVISGAPYRGAKVKSTGAWYYCGARLTPAAAARTEMQHGGGKLITANSSEPAIMAIVRQSPPRKRLDGRRRASV